MIPLTCANSQHVSFLHFEASFPDHAAAHELAQRVIAAIAPSILKDYDQWEMSYRQGSYLLRRRSWPKKSAVSLTALEAVFLYITAEPQEV